jgi:hypothetical protein
MILVRILGLLVAIVVGAAAALSLGDIKRYIRMRQM